jgi:2'-5' RNA ligase
MPNSSDEMVRLFVGVPLSGAVRKVLESWRETVRAELPFQKWTHPEDVHITLFFLGDTPRATAQALETELRPIAAATEPFELRIEGLGVFGAPAAPNILWAGVAGDTAALGELQRRVAAACARQGFEAEARAYRPHVTLARRYRGSGPFRRAALQAAPPAGGWPTWQVQDIVLYLSHLGRSPAYEPLGVYRLGE